MINKNIEYSLSIALLSLIIILSGCKETPLPQPELIDPIYAELTKKKNKAVEEIKRLTKALPKLEKKLEESKPQTGIYAVNYKKLFEVKENLSRATQKEKYYALKIESRLIYARKSYLKAFDKDLPWPDPKELISYKKLEKLRSASLNWNDRVPKLSDRILNNKTTVKKEPAEPKEGG